MSERDELKYHDLYLDLDGVMVDFDKHKYRIKNHFDSDAEMWAEINKVPHWFLNLDPMPDAFVLWNFLKQYKVTILTAIPRTAQKEHAADDKREWVHRYLGEDVPVITCYGIEKQEYAVRGYRSVLIDDTGRNVGQWVRRGGTGILHRDAENTIAFLKELQ